MRIFHQLEVPHKLLTLPHGDQLPFHTSLGTNHLQAIALVKTLTIALPYRYHTHKHCHLLSVFLSVNEINFGPLLFQALITSPPSLKRRETDPMLQRKIYQDSSGISLSPSLSIPYLNACLSPSCSTYNPPS